MQALLLKSAQLAQTKTRIEGCSRLNATHPLVILARSKVVVVVVGAHGLHWGGWEWRGEKKLRRINKNLINLALNKEGNILQNIHY